MKKIMKKWKKQFISVFLIVLMVLTGWNTGAVKEVKAESYNGYEYSVNDDGTVSIIKYSGSETELVIPGEIEGKKVTVIGENAFRNCSGLTSITIPEGVTNIRDSAFYYCSGLTSITIPEGVKSIGYFAFQGCTGLTSITVDEKNTRYDSRENCNAIIDTKRNELIAGCNNTKIPEGVTRIGWYAFDGCSGLTGITIPEGVTSIWEDAFRGCSGLTSITIPSSVTTISSRSFRGCTGLTSITVDEKNTHYDSRGNCNAIIDTERNELVLGCSNTKIPKGVTSIGGWAFEGCSGLTEIMIPEGVTEIETSAFEGCSSLTEITIPNSVTRIVNEAFSGCSGLTSITIPERVESIGQNAFKGCSGVTSIKVDEKNTCFDSRENCNAIIVTDANELVRGCNNTKIPEGVTRIGDGAFSGCSSLTSITIPASVESIFSTSFQGCSALTSITVDEKNTRYDSRENCNAIINTEKNELVVGCNNTKIPNSVTSIGFRAFPGSGLTSITIPNSVTTIIGYAFEGCSGLTEITIQEGVTSIGDSAFFECSGLTSITIPNSVTTIGNYVFSKCSGLTSITIPESVTSMGLLYGLSDDLVIWTTRNSYAEGYDKNNRITVKYIGEPEEPTAPVNPVPTEKPDTHAPLQPITQVQTKPQTPSSDVNTDPAQDQPSVSDLAIKGGVKTAAGKKKLTLTWKKVAKASGYQIQISKKKNFKGAKKISVSKSKKSYTVKKLKSGTVYYVQIRAYAKHGGKTVYGKWVSEKKKVK